MGGAQGEDLSTLCLDMQFSCLWRLAQPRLNGLAFRLAGRNHADAQDLLSEVMLRLFMAFRKQQGQIGNFPAWAATALRNQSTERFRRMRRRREPSEQLTECQFAAVGLIAAPPKTFPLLRAEAERAGQLRRHIRSLPKIYRNAFVLHCILLRPYALLAEQTGVSQATLRKRVQLAKKMIRRKIDAESPAPLTR